MNITNVETNTKDGGKLPDFPWILSDSMVGPDTIKPNIEEMPIFGFVNIEKIPGKPEKRRFGAFPNGTGKKEEFIVVILGNEEDGSEKEKEDPMFFVTSGIGMMAIDVDNLNIDDIYAMLKKF